LAFFCDECDARYEHKPSLVKHKINRHERDPVVLHRCNDCDLSFDKPSELTRHRRTVHKDKPAVTCEVT
jgi:hypothetical protein